MDALLLLQRNVTERLLLSALHEAEEAEEARASRERATFLAEAGQILASSLDESATERAIAGLSLPSVADWCVVDLIDDGRSLHRLAIVHRDSAKRNLIDTLEQRWVPLPTDSFGIPIVLEDKQPVQITKTDAMFERSAADPEVAGVLRELRIGALLTVPLLANRKVLGAITFFANEHTESFSDVDIELACGLATRAALALEKARLYTETLRLKNAAEGEANATTAFLRSISHELRTPLQAIAGYVEIMVRGVHGPVTDEQRLDLERIIGSQRHLLILINELIEFMRSGGSRGTLQPKPISVEGAVRRAFEVVEPIVNSKKIDAAIRHSCAGLTAIADENKLHQILINLIANAIKFTDSNGKIILYCDSRPAHITIAVTDTGRGIAEDKFEAIFEPFTQLKPDDGARLGGLGLGLSISRDLARAMNGDISVQSTVGAGSTFTVTLPAAPKV